mmetsp:Transcript_25794/g.38107  ORF Transcript_25794/g.38107 Transcript_25794/m.38107 type:complete len:103 (-) Transcript_25794:275-583(-)
MGIFCCCSKKEGERNDNVAQVHRSETKREAPILEPLTEPLIEKKKIVKEEKYDDLSESAASLPLDLSDEFIRHAANTELHWAKSKMDSSDDDMSGAQAEEAG